MGIRTDSAPANRLRRVNGEWIKSLAPVLTLLVVVIAMAVGNGSFLSPTNLETLMVQVAALLIMALGVTFVIIMGSIDISFAEIANLASVVIAVTIGTLGYLVVPLAILVGALAGLLNGILFVKGRMPSLVVTLGTTGLLSGLAYTISGGPPISLRNGMPYLSWITGSTLGIPHELAIALILTLALIFVQRYTWYGRSVYAIGAGEETARLSGIRIDLCKVLTFVLCGACAGLGGLILAARLVAGSPIISAGYLLYVLAAVLVGGTAVSGGTGSVVRTLIGALIITALRNGMNVIGVDIYAQQLILGAMLVVAVILTIDRAKMQSIK